MDVPPPLGRERGRGPLGRVVRGPGPGGVIASVEGWTVELPESGGSMGAPPARCQQPHLTGRAAGPTVLAMITPRSRGLAPVSVLAATLVLASFCVARPTTAVAAEGEMRWGLHVTLAARWLDPAETEAFSTPFMVLYAVHDALVKPMPAGLSTPSLAESWSESRDHFSYTFTLRKNAKFHDGSPVTAEDVKFSFERYKGASATLLKEKVSDVQVLGPTQVRFVLRDPWPDFMLFYGTTASGAGWIVPRKYVEKVGEDGFKK